MLYTSDPINVALAAFGMSGSVYHAPLLAAHPGFRLVKVLERSGRHQSKEKYPQVAPVKDYAAILNDSAVDLVVVNTPEYTHYEMAKQALLAGKHVVVEKAFTATASEAEELIKLAAKQGKILSVFQNSRWHGDFITLQNIIRHQLLGPLVAYEAHYDRYRNYIKPGTWKEEVRPGSGSLYNLGSHMIDQVLVLFGWPGAVYADTGIQREGGKVADNFTLLLYYDRLKITLKSSYLVREPAPRYTLHGTLGSFVKYGTDPQEAWLSAGRSPLEAGYGNEPASQWGKLNTQLAHTQFEGRVETKQASYLGFYENIYGAIKNKEALLVKPEQALGTIKIIEAAIKASAEKQVITLAPFGRHLWPL